MKFLNKLNRSSALIAVACIASACAPHSEIQTTQHFVAPDGGLVMLEGEIVGEAAAHDTGLATSDCYGMGYGVRMKGVTGEEGYLYDSNTDPCKHSEVMFDGKSAEGKRMSDPTAVTIQFHDSLEPAAGPIDDMVLPEITAVDDHFETLPENAAQKGFAIPEAKLPEKLGGLESTIEQWKHDSNRKDLLLDAQKLLAHVRDVNRMDQNQLLKTHQDYIVELEMRLRAMEQENNLLKDNGNRLVVDLNSAQSIAESDKFDLERREDRLNKDLSQMAQKVQQYQVVNDSLRKKYAHDERAYRARIDELTAQLREAENQADQNRQSMVLEAAKKIAEAEYLAQEAQLAKRLTMQRRAQRLQLEAGDILNQAEGMAKGQAIVLPAFSGLENMPRFKVVADTSEKLEKPSMKVASSHIEQGYDAKTKLFDLEKVTVNLNEQNSPLEEVFESAFDDVADRAGLWQVVWQLKPENEALKHEEWTVIAEAPFNQFLAYVSEKVRNEQQVKLSFQRFDQGRLFVISDE